MFSRARDYYRSTLARVSADNGISESGPAIHSPRGMTVRS